MTIHKIIQVQAVVRHHRHSLFARSALWWIDVHVVENPWDEDAVDARDKCRSWKQAAEGWSGVTSFIHLEFGIINHRNQSFKSAVLRPYSSTWSCYATWLYPRLDLIWWYVRILRQLHGAGCCGPSPRWSGADPRYLLWTALNFKSNLGFGIG